eukprot:COSAG05_NODE_31_length_28416_cov_170.150652_5_plen_64_part_00
MVGILTVNFQSLSFLFFMHALCAYAQGSVDLHVESYGVAGPLVETLYRYMYYGRSTFVMTQSG